jgi:hypothetical protein
MKNKQSFYKCKNCGDEIGVNTNSRLVYCKCGNLGIDGNGHYVRIIGEKDDPELIEKFIQ